MSVKYLRLCLSLVLSAAIIIFLISSCKKLNDATTLGGDLIPVVDNISTFDTTLEVEAYNGTFSLAGPDVDSLRSRGVDIQYLGNITNDPLFGTSSGTIFAQLKPATYRYSFGFSNPDSLVGLDSVVLVLKYVHTFGDTVGPQSVNIYEIDQASDFKRDSSYLIRQNNITYSNLLGTATYSPIYLDDSIHLFKDSASHQLRIRLDDAFGQRLLAYDSSSTSTNNAYYSDSTFNLKFKGFAIVPGGTGNALIGIDLTSSKLAVYYKYKHGTLDTAVANFTYNSGFSAAANYIQRDYTGSQLQAYQGGTIPQDLVFVQTQPGTFAKIKTPGLSTLNNRIIHRAELIVTQAFNDPLDNILTPPSYLYLDAYDTAAKLYRPIPFDITFPDQTTGSLIPSNTSFGFSGKSKSDGANTVKEWRFNISRYVQNVVMGKQTAFDLRLYAPYISLNTYEGATTLTASYVNTTTTTGQVRVYGGDATKANPNRMRLRIIYSKI